MKKKEPVGEDDTLPEEITGKLDSLTAEDLRVCMGSDCLHAYMYMLAKSLSSPIHSPTSMFHTLF